MIRTLASRERKPLDRLLAMAPAMVSPMTQSPSTPTKRSRRMLPIIPVVPRSLDKKPKEELKSPKSERTVAAPPTTESSNGIFEENTGLMAEEGQNEDKTDMDTRETVNGYSGTPAEDKNLGMPAFQRIDLSLVTNSIDGDNPLSSDTQDVDYGKQAFKLPPAFHPKQSPPAPISTECQVLGSHGNAVQDPQAEPLKADEETKSQQETKVNHHPLRATASIFHAHQPSLSDITASPAASPQTNLGLVQSSQQHPPANNAMPSPVRHAFQGYGHGHNISFRPPPPTSSNDPSSPTHSLYQGYAYTSGPREYSPNAGPPSQYSPSYPPHFQAYVSPRQQYAQQSPYYSNIPSFTTLGSQAPLTPSATPLDAMPEPWKLPNSFPHTSLTNGTSTELQPSGRSDSYSTLKSDNLLSGDPHTSTIRQQPLPNGTQQSEQWSVANLDAMYGAPIPQSFDEVPLAEHLLRHFNNPEYADCELVLSHSKRQFPNIRWYLSSILLIQSKTLQDLLMSSKFSDTGPGARRLLRVRVDDRFITPASMDSALRVLYGIPSSTIVAPISHDDSTRAVSEFSAVAMRENLSYAASGRLLRLKRVVLQGLQTACGTLNWDNLEAALSFALEPGLESEVSTSTSVMPAYSAPPAHDSDPSSSGRVVFTPSSSSDPTGQQSDIPSTSTSSPESHRRPLPQSAYDLLMRCLDFIAHNFPSSWELDPSARPLADVDRLPVTAESRSPLSKSRLSRIQFGDHPSEAAAKSRDRNVLISTILLSIPFVKLDYLLRSVGEPLARNIGPIVKERERRRQIVLQSKSVPWYERVAANVQEWAEAGYEESVETDDHGDTKISRRYTGIGPDPTDEDTTHQ